MVRAFHAAPVRRDLIQDLYVKELKAYKAPKTSGNDAAEHTKGWSQPATPTAPTLESDISDQLKSYESEVVELEGLEAGETAVPVEDWFEEGVSERRPARY